ncbi:hypothetical protein ACFLUU_03885 [Chloroflexota bacterium]
MMPTDPLNELRCEADAFITKPATIKQILLGLDYTIAHYVQ